MNWLKEKFQWLREKLKGWKTVVVGAFFGLPLALLQILDALSLVDLSSILPDPWGGRLALAVTVAMILLRLITTGPIGSKGDEEPALDVKAGD